MDKEATPRTRRTVVIGLLGPVLDAGPQETRWERWRPTVSLCQHEDFLVHRFELLHDRKFAGLAKTLAEDIASVSPETEVRPVEVAMGKPWDFEDVYAALHDFARGYAFDIEREEYLVHITTGTHVAQICLYLLTESRHLPGKLLQSMPPRKRPAREAGAVQGSDLDLSKYDRLAMRFEKEQSEGLSFLKSGIDTRNARFNRLMEEIERVAISARDPILLLGPTGSGKSRLARRIYELKRARRQVEGPFVEVNCATVRGDAAMSALFGHRKGAFTGALSDRQGLLKAAGGGILFLDEIGELGRDEQAMLLRAVEEKRFLPLGSDQETESDFQLIAGTNRDLRDQVAAGEFREDLLARINLWTFELPGLRQRLEDLAPNIDYELEGCARLTGKQVSFSKEARDLFSEYAVSPAAEWRGNFRDLNAAITRLATLAPGGRITVEGVREEIRRLRASWQRSAVGEPDAVLAEVLGAEGAARLDRFERVQLADAIAVVRQSRSLSEAGRTLFAASRARKKSTNDADRLKKYLARFGLEWEGLKAGAASRDQGSVSAR
jgi:transcriptional regulatory protein RtcR